MRLFTAQLTELLRFLTQGVISKVFREGTDNFDTVLNVLGRCKNAVSLDGIAAVSRDSAARVEDRRNRSVVQVERAISIRGHHNSREDKSRGPPKSSADLKVLRLDSRSFRRRLNLTAVAHLCPRFRFVSLRSDCPVLVVRCGVTIVAI